MSIICVGFRSHKPQIRNIKSQDGSGPYVYYI